MVRARNLQESITQTPRIVINGTEIGDNCAPYIIAEGCNNHNGNLEIAKSMAYEAKKAGANCIKFQHHIVNEEMLHDGFEATYDCIEKTSLTISEHKELKEYCDNIGITYLCTPFSYKAACELEEAGIAYAYKIGSGEMTDIPTLKKIAAFGKPMIISTGMSTIEEIDRTYEALKDIAEFAFTNCISEYPPKYEDMNIGVISKMKERYPNIVIGHSDHTTDLYTSFAAVALGACIIEKHFVLDKNMNAPDIAVSIDPKDLKELVDGCKKIFLSMGSKKKVHLLEQPCRDWAFRSIIATRDIKKGELIDESTIWSKRPGTGIPSYRMNELLGKIALVDIKANTIIHPNDIKDFNL